MIVLPDIIGPTVTYLNSLSEVTALVGNRIGTRLPEREVWPAVRLDPIGGFTLIEFRLDQPALQVHACATTDILAMTVARTLRAALYAMAGYQTADCVIVDVTTSSPQLLPDESRTPPVSHATFTATVAVRPNP